MSHFCLAHSREFVRKARKKAKATASPTYHRIDRLSTQMGNAAKINLVKGIRTFRTEVHPAEVEAAVRSGSLGRIMSTIPWQNLPDHLNGFDEDMGKTYSKATDFAIQGLPAPTQRNLRFDIKNPRLRKFIQAHTGERIVEATKDTQTIVQRAVQRAFTKAYTPNKVARQIVDSIGLDPRREQALANYRDTLESSGSHTDEAIDRLVDRYAERLLTSRAKTIGRTEVRQATSQGQLSVWREASNQGLLDRETTRKSWIVDGNPCDICEPMDGELVGIDEMWVLPTGELVEVPSDSHPNCLCGMDLEFVQPGEES